MNAIPSEVVGLEKNNTEVVREGDEGMVEMGTVSGETKGSPFGFSGDTGGGRTFGP